jgi:hypothetical protein
VWNIGSRNMARWNPKAKMPVLAGGLFDFDYLAAFIETTLEAGAMRQFAFVTVGTFGQRLRRQMIMSPALSRARFRMAPFWIRHENLAAGSPRLGTPGTFRLSFAAFS